MASTGLAGEDQTPAGYWGDYNCDLPLRTLEAMMAGVRDNDNIDFDYIIYTGDSPAHDGEC